MLYDKKFNFQILTVLNLSWNKLTKYAAPRNFHAISMRLHGDADFLTKKQTYNASKNSIIYIPEGVGYTLKAKQDENVIVIHFKVIDKTILNNIEVFNPINNEVFADLFTKIYNSWLKKSVGYEFKVDSLFLQILEKMKIQATNPTFNLKNDFANLIEYINVNFADQNLNVETCSKIMKISSTYLRKLFQKHLGITPLKYITTLRMDYATSLLMSGFYTIEEVSSMSGFTDSKYFSTTYKKHYGFSPSTAKRLN